MYFNTLIIMNEDASGYGNRSRKPSGYCKLTMPNRVSCYVQGLRSLPNGQIYRLYLTSKSRQQSVEVGMLQVGANGTKETRWVMNPSSINNSGVNAEAIDGAFIIVSGDDIKGQVVPLVGFSSEPYSWEHLVKHHKEIIPQQVAPKETPRETGHTTKTKVEITPMIEISKSLEAEKADVVAEVSRSPEIEKAHVPTEISQSPEINKVDLVIEANIMREESEPIIVDERSIRDQASSDEILALKVEVEKLNRTIKESKAIIETLQKQTIKEEKVLERVVKVESPPEPLENTSGINEYINDFITRFQAADKQEQDGDCEGIGSIFKKRIPINPFEAQNTGIKWVRITHEDLTSFPSLDHEWINQPFLMDAHRDYKHFILGRDESGLAYYLGIPDVFDPNQEDLLNIDKIERFSCCQNVPPRAGEAGYWIAMI